MAVSEFKARCLEVLDTLQRRGRDLVLTRRGEPIARVSPLRSQGRPLRGLYQGRIGISGDIVEIDLTDDWETTR